MPGSTDHDETAAGFAERVEQEGQSGPAGESGRTETAQPRLPKFISRTEWLAAPPAKWSTDLWPAWGGIVLHHEGSGHKTLDNHRHDNPFERSVLDCYWQVRHIQLHHMNPLPFIDDYKYDDIAYNYLVCIHGYTFVGRGIRIQPGANGSKDANRKYYAICGLLGSDDEPSDPMLREMKTLVDYLKTHDQIGTKVPKPHVKGHKDVYSDTDCPGNLYPYIKKGYFE